MNIEVFEMKLNFVIILLIFFVLTIFAEQTDYCSIHSSHFFCSNRAPNRDPVVVKHYPDKDKEEIATIVELFNNFRSFRANGTNVRGDQIENNANNMLEMQWDEELATIAKMVASRRADDVTHFSFCCSCNILDRFESNALIRDYDGESEKIVWKDTLVKQLFIQMEFRINQEHQKHIANLTMKFWLDDPFYLLVRAETYLVGCDLAIYKQYEQIRHRLVCIFGPVTSWIGEKVYDFGTPCSKCPASTECSSDNPSLCKCKDVCYPKTQTTKMLSNSEAVTTDFFRNKLTAENKHYCSVNHRHFLCILINHPHSDCVHKEVLPKNDSYRKKILKVFNQYRNRVAGGDEILGGVKLPSASNMLQLDWDNELELAAKNIVESCRLKYFEFCCNCHQFDRFTANFFQIEIEDNIKLDSKEPDWNIILGLLLEKYSTQDMGSFNIKNITDEFYSEKRFELIARAEIQRLGCAIIKFSKGLKPLIHEGVPTYLAVCVFAGLSGWKGTPIYTPGKPGSNCGPKAKCSRDSLFKNLCVCPPKQYCCPSPNNNTFVWFNDSQSNEFRPIIDLEVLEEKYLKNFDVIDVTDPIEVKELRDATGASTEFLYHNVRICFAYFIFMSIYMYRYM